MRSTVGGVRCSVLGPLEVRRAAEGEDGPPVTVPGAKERALLAVLIARAGQPVSTDELAEALWNGDQPPSAAKSLQAHVVRLRSALEPERPKGSAGQYVVRRGAGYALSLEGVDVDALQLAERVARGRARLESGRYDEAVEELQCALALWRGQPYADWPDADFAQEERRRLTEVRLMGFEALADAQTARGRPQEVVSVLERLVGEQPFREGLWLRLALALYRSGRQADALAALRRVRDLLADELGVDPGPELQDLERRILAQDPELGTAAPLPPATPVAVPERACPYKGLAPYEPSDAALFHGRDRLVTSLVAQLVDHRLLVVSGPSGAGKSSVVRAGVVPALGRGALPGSQRWRPYVITPGHHPVDALAGAAGDDGDPVLLVLDQLEEVWTAGAQPAERDSFFDEVLGLLADGRAARVVGVVRGDHLGRLAEHPRFAELASGAVALVPPLSEDELRAVVVQPATQVGLEVDPELVDTVVADVRGQVGSLPLLSTALVGTWERRRGDRLVLAGYLEAGGVETAVARAAEAAYTALDEASQRRARGVLVRLADVGEGGGPVRRRVRLSELGFDGPGGGERRAVVETFVRRRLLSVDDEQLEVAHEALLTAWPRLAGWLEEDAVGRAVRRHLAPAAAEWEAHGRPDDELYRGSRLAAALEWAAGGADLTPVEQAYVAASEAQAEAELQEAQERAEREAAARVRTRRLAAGLAGVLVLALIAGAVAVQQSVRAGDRARAADRAALVADATGLAARAGTVTALDTSLLLAAQAVRTVDVPDTRDGLLSALVQHRQALGILRPPVGSRPLGLAVSGDGRSIYGALNTATVVRWDALDPAEPSVVLTDERRVVPVVAAASSGDVLAVAADDRITVRGDGRTPVEVGPERLGGQVGDMAFAADGRSLVVALITGPTGQPATAMELRLVDTVTGAVTSPGLRRGLPPDAEPAPSVARDGRTAVLAALDGVGGAEVVDLRTGRRVPLAAKGSAPGRIVALPLGPVHLGSDGATTLYDATTGRVRQRVVGHTSSVQQMVLAPDGRAAVSVADDRRVVVWDVDQSQPAEPLRVREVLEGHRGRIVDIAFSGDSRRVYTAALDGTVIGWDLADRQRFGRPAPSIPGRGFVGTPALAGGHVVAASRDFDPARLRFGDDVTLAFVDPASNDVVQQVPLGRTVPGSSLGASVAAAGTRIAATSGYRTTVLDAADRRRLGEIVLPPPSGSQSPEIVWSAAWGPDARHLYLGTEGSDEAPDDGSVVVVDPGTLRPTTRIAEGGDVQSLAVSPDGSRLAVAREELGNVVVVDPTSGELLHTLPVTDLDVVFSVAYSPDGRWLAAASWNGHVSLWDAATGRPVREPVRLHQGYVLQVAWIDDETLVSTGTDGRAVLYDARRGLVRGQPLPAFADGGDGWSSLALGPDRELLLLGQDRPGRRYSLDTSSWLAHACLVASRDLTPAEWQAYVPRRPYARTCGDLA